MGCIICPSTLPLGSILKLWNRGVCSEMERTRPPVGKLTQRAKRSGGDFPHLGENAALEQCWLAAPRAPAGGGTVGAEGGFSLLASCPLGSSIPTNDTRVSLEELEALSVLRGTLGHDSFSIPI